MKTARIAILSLVMLGGCTSYYRVTDPNTGKEYYTTEVKNKNGSTTLHDARTNQDVTIQNSEVMQISQQQYDAARNQ